MSDHEINMEGSGILPTDILQRIGEMRENTTDEIPMTEKDIAVSLTGDLEIRIIYAGVFVSKDGQEIEYDDHIKFSSAGFNMRITPLQLAKLTTGLRTGEIHKILSHRFENEKVEINETSF